MEPDIGSTNRPVRSAGKVDATGPQDPVSRTSRSRIWHSSATYGWGPAANSRHSAYLWLSRRYSAFTTPNTNLETPSKQQTIISHPSRSWLLKIQARQGVSQI